MLRLAPFLLALTVAIAGSAAIVAAQDAGHGTVQGVVYWDRDADGTRDSSEPPLNLGALLMEPESTGIFASASNSRDGQYSITYAPGTYRVEPAVETSAGICVDTLRGSYRPFAASSCYSAPLPYHVTAPGEPFALEAGKTRTIDLPVLVRDQMVFSIRAIEEDHYARPGDTITAMVDGKQCGTATVPATIEAGERDNNFALLVDGDGSVNGCAAPGDLITFHLNGRQAHNSAVGYQPFDPSPNPLALDHHHIRRVDLIFMEDWAWFWSDDVRAFDGGEIKGAQIAAVVNGKECALGRPVVGLLDEITGGYGFGPVMVGLASVEGGGANPGDTVEFRIGFDAGELVKTAVWQPGVTELTDIVLQDPPRPISDLGQIVIAPPNTGAGGRGDASAKPLRALLLSGGVFVGAGALLRRRRAPQ